LFEVKLKLYLYICPSHTVSQFLFISSFYVSYTPPLFFFHLLSFHTNLGLLRSILFTVTQFKLKLQHREYFC